MEKIGETPKIPNNLFDVIEKEISPEYLLREKRSNLKTDLMVCTAAAAISATLLPDPFSRMVSWIILLLGVPILYSLIKTMPRNTVWKSKMIVASSILLFIGSAILFSGSVLFVIIWISESERVGNIPIYFAIAFFTFAIFWAVVGLSIKQGKILTITQVLQTIKEVIYKLRWKRYREGL